MVYNYCNAQQAALASWHTALGMTLLFLLFSEFVIPFDVSGFSSSSVRPLIGYLTYQGFVDAIIHYLLITLFAVGSIIFFYSADYVLNDVMEPHQRVRINVLLRLG
jgi:rod shape determining protein RodA